jgi:hypothetical protein
VLLLFGEETDGVEEPAERSSWCEPSRPQNLFSCTTSETIVRGALEEKR